MHLVFLQGRSARRPFRARSEPLREGKKKSSVPWNWEETSFPPQFAISCIKSEHNVISVRNRYSGKRVNSFFFPLLFLPCAYYPKSWRPWSNRKTFMMRSRRQALLSVRLRIHLPKPWSQAPFIAVQSNPPCAIMYPNEQAIIKPSQASPVPDAEMPYPRSVS